MSRGWDDFLAGWRAWERNGRPKRLPYNGLQRRKKSAFVENSGKKFRAAAAAARAAPEIAP